ncbi:MAG TPA: twin-arginine translocation signal domain-containing protein, partial [Saprospiraceae bacterium]|nr:twin-arginine translocation signal domain-containing protein [Saprospiraceae bacterium]
MSAKLNRRKFLQSAALTGAALATPKILDAATEPATLTQTPRAFKSRLKLGFIGVGLRGQDHVNEALLRDDCEVVAIADPDPGMIASCLKMIADKGKKKPAVYDQGNFDYLRLVADKNVDAVV